MPVKGNDLINTVANLSGLPPSWAQDELYTMIHGSGHAPSSLTLDELRNSMILYLEDLHRQMIDSGYQDDCVEELSIVSKQHS